MLSCWNILSKTLWVYHPVISFNRCKETLNLKFQLVPVFDERLSVQLALIAINFRWYKTIFLIWSVTGYNNHIFDSVITFYSIDCSETYNTRALRPNYNLDRELWESLQSAYPTSQIGFQKCRWLDMKDPMSFTGSDNFILSTHRRIVLCNIALVLCRLWNYE